jgi:hypothetical protein
MLPSEATALRPRALRPPPARTRPARRTVFPESRGELAEPAVLVAMSSSRGEQITAGKNARCVATIDECPTRQDDDRSGTW